MLRSSLRYSLLIASEVEYSAKHSWSSSRGACKWGGDLVSMERSISSALFNCKLFLKNGKPARSTNAGSVRRLVCSIKTSTYVVNFKLLSVVINIKLLPVSLQMCPVMDAQYHLPI